MVINIKTNIGIYILKQKETVVYVGQSKNLLHRIGTHFIEKKKVFDNIEIIECDILELDSNEIKYITLYKPLYNIKMPTNLISLSTVNKKLKPMMPYEIKQIIKKLEIPLHVKNFSVGISKHDVNKIIDYCNKELK